ncbi:hypothetical protein [Vallitalea maricola]|uniref:Uncharacterized protein n=1 Tax=Vallitalea maricola TaxID=3074433 RepID=A0ACB5UGZ3_9FIRM|nr:hypothetical protein AN2V17_10800 [Vallitalea sp. AN17-2]
MSDCKICFHKGDGKFMRRPVEGNCPVCNPEKPVDPENDACVCPPLGEPNSYMGTHFFALNKVGYCL